ncbi:MAG TPA: efflux RND transporter permease subunit [Actinomycetota bacterium]|nr:efflux RND transporter permease subunit [Actinomycetota bacterium]
MMRWLVGSSLKFRRLIVALGAGVIVLGITQLGKTSVDVLPEFSPPTVEVQTEALGLSAAEVEELITVPLEQDLLNGVAFLDEIESASLPGLSSVVMTFEPGTDVLDARQVVQERLTQAHALPNVSKPPQMIQPLSSTSRVSLVRLTSKELTPIEMSVLARWVIMPRLLGVEGVANVAIWGQRERQLQVQVVPERLQAQGVSLQQVIRTAGNALEVSPLSYLEASTPGTGGFIDTVNQRLQIFHEQTISTPDELAQVTLEDAEGNAVFRGDQALTLGDVTEVVEDHQPLIGDAFCTDGPCLLLVVEKFPAANAVEVTEGVDSALDAMRPGLPGMELDTSIYRPAEFVEAAFDNLGGALLFGGILLALILGAFFFDWRTALVGTVAIALSLLTAGLVLYFRGATVNTIALAGLAMALVALIDDAVFDFENISRRMRRHRQEGNGGPTWRIILDASMEMRGALLYASLIVIAALLPFFFMENEAGAFLPPVAVSYILAIAASMFIALTATPALAMLLLSNASLERRESPVVRWLGRGYDRVSSRVVSRFRPALTVFGALMLAGLVAVPFLDTSLRPSLKERNLLVQLEAAPGTSLPRMNELTADAVEMLGSVPGVRDVGAHVGRAVMSDQIVNVNSGEIWVNLDPSADYEATVTAVDETIDGIAGVSSEVLTYSDQRITDILKGTDDDIVVRVYGENDEVLRTKAEEIRGILSRTAGVEDPEVQLEPEEQTIQVEVDLAKAQSYRVKPGDVRRAAAILLSGITVGNLFEEQKVFDVVVWGAPEIRQSEADVRDLLIDTPDGEQVRLGDVADVSIVPNTAVIRHESVSTYVDVSANLEGRDSAAVSRDIERALRGVQFPLAHHAELLGGAADQEAARTRLITIAVAAAIGIFLLLQAAFASWRLATIAFVTLPMALVGGALAVLITGGTITLGSLAGLVAVLGIAARGGIVLIRHYQHLERHEGETFGADLVLRGTRDRLAPTLITALAAAAALLPFLFAGNGAGFELVHPMVIAILGGLVTSTVLNLVVLPAAYLRFGFVREPDTIAEELVVTLPEVEPVTVKQAESIGENR